MEPLTELGFYTLAGHSDSPRDLVDEVRQGGATGPGVGLCVRAVQPQRRTHPVRSRRRGQ